LRTSIYTSRNWVDWGDDLSAPAQVDRLGVGTVSDVDTVIQPNWAVMVRRDDVAYGFAKSIKSGRTAAMIKGSLEWTFFDPKWAEDAYRPVSGRQGVYRDERPE
jgi:hypothetical protein